jgi:Na+/proline symporter
MTVLAIGVPTVVYTMLGGVQAVTWTDVKQMVIIFLGLSAVVAVIAGRLPEGVSFGGALAVAGQAGKLQTMDFSFDVTETYTFWSGLLGGFFLMLSYFGCDQSQVQRFLTSQSISQGRTSLLMSAVLKIPIQFGILMIGVLVFVFFQFVPPPLLFNPVTQTQMAGRTEYQALEKEYIDASRQVTDSSLAVARGESSLKSEQAYQSALSRREQIRSRVIEFVKEETGDANFTDVNYVFPAFVVSYLPVGIVGLLIAAIFAAAMSSISSELNSLSTATVIDFYRRHFKPEASDDHYLLVSKLSTAFWGTLACGVAVFATQLGSLIEVVNRFGSLFYGSLLGVFILALGTKWATPGGAFAGLLSGMLAVAVVSLTTEISYLWYNVVGAITVVLVALIIAASSRSR